ncbi:sensor histidine kinase [Olivibacter sitiensis]|uniref:sensor histidine kinase n=1 Tax=Olivibacter sitiensis TaxID=376470 RepID=UPI000402091C|nr:histidine kinase [Olivibacter sitiensis]
MPKRFFIRETLKIQAALWLCFLLLMTWMNYHHYPQTRLSAQLLVLLLLIGAFNLCTVPMYLFFLSARPWLAPPLVGMLFWPLAQLVFAWIYRWMPRMGLSLARSPLDVPDADFYWRMANPYLMVLLAAAALVLRVKSKMNALLKAKEEKLKHEQTLLARESELAFLAAQINPHFLYNVLTSIQQQCRTKMPSVAYMLERLAGLLRYNVYHASNRVRKVVVEKEIDALKRYLELESARFEACYANLAIKGEACGQKLPPGLFITLVENAFKYGISRNPEKPIDICLYLYDEKIVFRCSNWIDHGRQSTSSTGLGLKNTAYRLEMVFPDRYELQVHDGHPDIYRVSVTIYQ